MNGQTVLLTALSLAAIALAAVAAWTVWRLLKTVEKLSMQMDRTLQQFEGMAEDIRRTNAVIHRVMGHAEASAANVEHLTEGVRRFRNTLDAATAVLQFAVVPVLGNVAGALAGTKAAFSHIASRFFGKEAKNG